MLCSLAAQLTNPMGVSKHSWMFLIPSLNKSCLVTVVLWIPFLVWLEGGLLIFPKPILTLPPLPSNSSRDPRANAQRWLNAWVASMYLHPHLRIQAPIMQSLRFLRSCLVSAFREKLQAWLPGDGHEEMEPSSHNYKSSSVCQWDVYLTVQAAVSPWLTTGGIQGHFVNWGGLNCEAALFPWPAVRGSGMLVNGFRF